MNQHLFRCLLFLGLLLWFPASAFGQEDPLKLSFINVAASGGDQVHSTINEFLEGSADIDYTPQAATLREASRLGLETRDFRSAALRERNAETFRTLMRNLDLETIFALDVFGRGGSTAQIIVIGPDGLEIADIRRDINRGRITRDAARSMLAEAFGPLVPIVRDFRQRAPEPEPEPEPDNLVVLGDPDEPEDSIKQQVIRERRQRTDSPLETGWKISGGALLGTRSLELSANEGGFVLNHKSPFVGASGRLDAIFASLSAGDAAIGASVYGGYAPFTTIFDGEEEFSSAYARLAAELKYMRLLSDELILEIFAGADAVSITIDQNPFYTGHRYISARAGLGIVYDLGPASFKAGGAVLYVIDVLNSDGAYGEGESAIAFEGNAGLSFNLTDEISATLAYTFQRYALEFQEPLVLGADLADSVDMIHAGFVMIGYSPY